MTLPRGLSAIAARLYALAPERVASRFLPNALRYDPSTTPIAHATGGRGPRLLVAPVNFAGQGEGWARAVRRHVAGADAVSLAYRVPGTGLGFPVGVDVPASAYALSRSWHRRQMAAIESGFSHVLVEAGRSPAGAPYLQSTARQLRILRDAGVRFAYLAHGSDVRVPSLHAAEHPDSPFRSGDHSALERQARENIALIGELGLPAFVSTPDLLEFLPGATWVPVVTDPERWATEAPALARRRPIVAHAPSSGPMKGTDAIDPVMTVLHDQGLIEYRRVQGVPSADMPEVYRGADIVLDQFRIGGYGVAACEAMAAGRVVIGHVAPAVRRIASEAAGSALPIVESTAGDLDRVVRGILRDRDRFAAIAGTGPGFVRELHDGAASAAVLEVFLDS